MTGVQMPAFGSAPLDQSPRTVSFKVPLDRFDAIIVISILALYAIVVSMPLAPKKFGDRDFHTGAKVLAEAVKGSRPWSEVEFIRAPGPVLYYAVPYLAVPAGSTDESYWRASLPWTVFWMTASIFWIRRSAALLFGVPTGRIAVLLAFLTPFWVYYSYGINGESPAFISASLAAYGWSRWVRSSQPLSLVRGGAWMLWTGIWCFLLNKPAALPMLGMALLAAAWLWYAQRARHGQMAKFILLGAPITIVLTLASSWFVESLSFRRPMPPQTRYLRWTMFFGSFQCRTEPWDWRFWDKTNRSGSADYQLYEQELESLKQQAAGNNMVLSKLHLQWTLNDFRNHPGLRLKMMAVRSLMLHVMLANSRRPEQFEFGPLRGYRGYIVFHTIVNLFYVLVIAGAIWFLISHPRQIMTSWVLWGPWLALLLFHSAIYGEPRYVFPAQPGLLVMASAVFSKYLGRA